MVLQSDKTPLARCRARGARLLVRALLGGLFLALVAVLMVWLAGGFRAKVRAAPDAAQREPTLGEVVEVRLRSVPQVEMAAGTVQPVHRVEVASRILSRVVELNARAGQRVEKGDVLVRLDDGDLTARVKQAEAALQQAIATRDQARVEEARTRALYEQRNATPIELERDVTALRSADAAVLRAQQALDEARAVLSYATVVSPMTGVVIDKRVNVGDTASPGQVLVTLLDPTRMQLVAPVREALSRRLKVGQPIDVALDVLDHPCTGTISEIVPEADPASRSFAVKVTGPCPAGVYAGMFGRVLIPLDDLQVLVIPRAAVRPVGQLDLVTLRTPAGDERRVLRLGRTLGDEVEVLAGLSAGERVVVPRPADN